MLGRTCRGPLSLTGGQHCPARAASAQHDQPDRRSTPPSGPQQEPPDRGLGLVQPRIQSWVSGFWTTVICFLTQPSFWHKEGEWGHDQDGGDRRRERMSLAAVPPVCPKE